MVPLEPVPARGGRVELREAVLPGFVYFVSIHTRPTVVRGPAGEVYKDVPVALFLVGFRYLGIHRYGGEGVKSLPRLYQD